MPDDLKELASKISDKEFMRLFAYGLIKGAKEESSLDVLVREIREYKLASSLQLIIFQDGSFQVRNGNEGRTLYIGKSIDNLQQAIRRFQPVPCPKKEKALELLEDVFKECEGKIPMDTMEMLRLFVHNVEEEPDAD